MDLDRAAGTRVAGYAIESVLGRGAMGVVYRARQRSPDRRVALKLINPAVADDETFRARFLREARAAAAVDHPHILPVYDAGEAEGVLFIAMRLVDGKDLRAILRDPHPLELDRVLALVAQVGAALDAAHARGLIHRDVKPGNILVSHQADADDADFCYLTDFGVSTWTTSSAGTITSTGRMVGSLSYAAPEQIEGRPPGREADLYSLACVLFECLTGRPPFADRGAPGILYAHLHEQPPSLTSLRADLPPRLDPVVERALRKDPAGRYPSCRDLTLALRAAVSGDVDTVVAAAHRESSARNEVGSDALPGGVANDRPGERNARPAEPSEAIGRRRRASWLIGGAVATVLVLLAFGLVAALRSGNGTGRPPVGSSAGDLQLFRDDVQVTASLTAPASTDAAGNRVTYLPGNVLDGDVETAWRAPGDGRGVTLTLLFDNAVDVVKIGLIPGYAKTDPETGVNRFQQNRIIEQVRYLIPGISPITQTFRPVPVPQLVHVGATTSRITIEILDTTEPGGADDTAISEIYVYGYAQ